MSLCTIGALIMFFNLNRVYIKIRVMNILIFDSKTNVIYGSEWNLFNYKVYLHKILIVNRIFYYTLHFFNELPILFTPKLYLPNNDF